MALAVTTVWEVRTSGNVLNGGGWNPSRGGGGSDLSQSDSPAMTSSTLNCPNSTTLTSTGGGFTSAMVGNVICVAGTAYFEIVAYTSATAVTIDRAPGTLTNASGRVGGASAALGLVCAAVPAASAAGANVIYVKAGTYVAGTHFTNRVTPTNVGHFLNHHLVTGYNATRGDATAPCVTIDANDGNYDAVYSTKAYWRWEFLTATGRGAGVPTYAKTGFNADTSGDNNVFYRCLSTNTGSFGFRAVGNAVFFISCEATGFGLVTAAAGFGWGNTGAPGAAYGCYAHDGAGAGFNSWSTYAPTLSHCIADAATTHGFFRNYSSVSGIVSYTFCSAYGCGGSGFYTESSTSGMTLVHNCIAVNNTGFGIGANSGGKTRTILLGSAFFGNSGGEIDTNTIVQETVTRVTLTADPFKNAANGDFRLAASQRQALGSGWPGAFLSGGALTAWAGYPDLGAVQQAVRPVRILEN